MIEVLTDGIRDNIRQLSPTLSPGDRDTLMQVENTARFLNIALHIYSKAVDSWNFLKGRPTLRPEGNLPSNEEEAISGILTTGILIDIESEDLRSELGINSQIRRQKSIGDIRNQLSQNLSTLERELHDNPALGTRYSLLPLLELARDERQHITPKSITTLNKFMTGMMDSDNQNIRELMGSTIGHLLDKRIRKVYDSRGQQITGLPNFAKAHTNIEKVAHTVEQYFELYVQFWADFLWNGTKGSETLLDPQLLPDAHLWMGSLMAQYHAIYPDLTPWVFRQVLQTYLPELRLAVETIIGPYDKFYADELSLLNLTDSRHQQPYALAKNTYNHLDAARMYAKKLEVEKPSIDFEQQSNILIQQHSLLVKTLEGTFVTIPVNDDNISYIAVSATKGSMLDFIIISPSGDAILLQMDSKGRVWGGIPKEAADVTSLVQERNILHRILPTVIAGLEANNLLPRKVERPASRVIQSQPAQVRRTIVETTSAEPVLLSETSTVPEPTPISFTLHVETADEELRNIILQTITGDILLDVATGGGPDFSTPRFGGRLEHKTLPDGTVEYTIRNPYLI